MSKIKTYGLYGNNGLYGRNGFNGVISWSYLVEYILRKKRVMMCVEKMLHGIGLFDCMHGK